MKLFNLVIYSCFLHSKEVYNDEEVSVSSFFEAFPLHNKDMI